MLTTGCNHTAEQGKCYVFSKCTTTAEWVDDSTGFPYGGEPGGGGGCSKCNPAPLPNPDPCSPQTPNGAFYRVVAGCTGGGGDGDGDEPLTQDPCTVLQAKNNNPNYKAKITALNKPAFLQLKKETGFSENKNGQFTDIPQAASTATSDGLSVTVTPSTKGVIHTHLDDYYTGEVNENGEPIWRFPIRMFSPEDVNTLMTIASLNSSGDYSQIYNTMVASSGVYTIVFTGTSANIQTGFDSEHWKKDYIKYREKNKNWTLERLLLTFLQDEMQVQGVELYRIKNNGTVQKKFLNSNKKVESIDCP